MQGLWECRSDDVAQLEEGGQEEFGSDQVSGETFVGLSSTSESGPCFKKRGGWQWLALRVCPASKKGGWQWLALVLGEEQTVGSRQQNTSPVKTPASSEQSRKSKIFDFSYTDNQVNGQSTIFSFILL